MCRFFIHQTHKIPKALTSSSASSGRIISTRDSKTLQFLLLFEIGPFFFFFLPIMIIFWFTQILVQVACAIDTSFCIVKITPTVLFIYHAIWMMKLGTIFSLI